MFDVTFRMDCDSWFQISDTPVRSAVVTCHSRREFTLTALRTRGIHVLARE